MTKSKWFESTKKRSIVIFLCVFLIAAVGFCVKTGLTGGADKDIKIQTEYCDLYYPARWGKNIKILQTENDVQFRAEIEGYGLQPLFDIHFNSDAGTFCGVILTEDGAEVTVSQTTHPIEPKEEWPQEQLEMVRQMQAELTGILSQMPLTMPEPADAQAVQEATESTGVQEKMQDYNDIAIETPYGVLRYPADWMAYLRLNQIEGDMHTVEFYATVGDHPEQHLFDVRIGAFSGSGIPLYEENGETISLDIAFLLEELDQSWEEDESNIIYGMMDDVNHLLSMLETMEDNP